MSIVEWLLGKRKRFTRRYKYPILRRGLCAEMISLAEQSVDLFKSMPIHLSSVEKQLDQAEKYFKEGAFVPFWDSIETATKMLAHFDEHIGDLKVKASRYTEITRLYENEDALNDYDGSTH